MFYNLTIIQLLWENVAMRVMVVVNRKEQRKIERGSMYTPPASASKQSCHAYMLLNNIYCLHALLASRVMEKPFDHPPYPLPSQEGGGVISGGHPQTPAIKGRPSEGAKPLWTPLFQRPAI